MDEQPRAHYLLAHIQIDQRKPEAALVPMRKAVALDPVERQPWMELSQMYRTLGRTNKPPRPWPKRTESHRRRRADKTAFGVPHRAARD
jgi:Flp pilus assembly protein TadD